MSRPLAPTTTLQPCDLHVQPVLHAASISLMSIDIDLIIRLTETHSASLNVIAISIAIHDSTTSDRDTVAVPRN